MKGVSPRVKRVSARFNKANKETHTLFISMSRRTKGLRPEKRGGEISSFRYVEEGPEADLTVEAWGGTLGEAFGNAALAMFNAITPMEGVEQRVSRNIEVKGDDLGALLFDFLGELLYINDTELLVFSGFDVDVDEKGITLRAECRGEPFELGRHEQGAAIKAVTFYDMRIARGEGGWKIRVVFDT